MPHQRGHAVFLNIVEVDLLCLLGCALFLLLDVWSTKVKVYGEDNLRPISKNGEYPVAELTWVQRPQIMWGSSASNLVAYWEASSKMRSLMP
jgi:hypothetical protein